MTRTARPIRRSEHPTGPTEAGLGDVLAEISADADRRTHAAMSPEWNFIAALLNLTREEAVEVLALVHADDLADHLSKSVFVMIRIIVEQRGEQPTPQAVAALARGLGDKLAPLMLSADRIALWVAGVYSLGNPITTWSSARQVVEDAYRRRFALIGTRMTQMADAYAPIPDLEELAGDARRDWYTVRSRLITLTTRARQ
ncbi:hypothetical protein [Nocardia sp. NBC_01327]|uniref:hypothetical protein n=1 Tax=Nocardia sp. NBC_01327 TaxID=2903593 RepID=UPI002E0F0BB0|nr:hypothetical protein OG326_42440 [Nocardia sp. NBC_01327]